MALCLLIKAKRSQIKKIAQYIYWANKKMDFKEELFKIYAQEEETPEEDEADEDWGSDDDDDETDEEIEGDDV